MNELQKEKRVTLLPPQLADNSAFAGNAHVDTSGWQGSLLVEFIVGTLDAATGTVEGQMHIGGLVGDNCVGGTISESYATGQVKGDEVVGGLVGYNSSSIINDCYATGQVNGFDGVGGLVGSNDDGTVTSSYATGAVTSDDTVGGLVGVNGSGTISSCYAMGNVSGSDTIGGLVGNFYHGTISSSYAMGNVSGKDKIGGLVGRLSTGMISDCYATGAVEGEGFFGGVGGLVGSVGSLIENKYFGTIHNCYSTGSVIGIFFLGGLVGEMINGTVSNSFWDTQTSGQPTSDGGTGKTTVEMQMIATFTVAGWDFVGEAANGVEDIWRMCLDGVDYPRLTWEYLSIGDFGCPDGVGMGDFVLFANWWGATNCTAANGWCGGADFDWSGTVDMLDGVVFFGNWLSGI